MEHVLVIDDDEELGKLISTHLNSADIQASQAVSGEKAMELLTAQSFDLAILDLSLPGMDGVEVCKKIRHLKPNLAVLILSSRAAEAEKVLCLEVGADDYVTKPFGMRELLARVQALLRRAKRTTSSPEQVTPSVFGDLVIDRAKREVNFKGKALRLTTIEFDLLAFLSSAPGKAFTRDELLHSVWGYQYSGYEHTVNTHINRLRYKLEPDPNIPFYVKTVRGYGYSFGADSNELPPEPQIKVN